jgi:mitochondrial fission protein ELM1
MYDPQINHSMTKAKRPLVVWRLMDGKAGHEAQTAGLVQALGRMRAVECHDIEMPRRREMLRDWIRGRCRFGGDLPDPELLLGAGHRTHVALLAARRARGGKAVVLMRPSLPQCWFDCCLIPEHDQPRRRDNVIVTQGVLNTIQSAKAASPERGLILIGGPSEHYGWDSNAMIQQVRSVVLASDAIAWNLTTSRRTPPETEVALVDLDLPNLRVEPVAQTPRGWVGDHLAGCGLVWVSEDSVSMVYEALTAGAKVGLLEVPTKGKGSRVARGVESLLKAGRVLSFAEPLPSLAGQKPLDGFNEAERCAAIILEKFNSLT